MVETGHGPLDPAVEDHLQGLGGLIQAPLEVGPLGLPERLQDELGRVPPGRQRADASSTRMCSQVASG